MTDPLTPAQQRPLQAALLARRAALADQRSDHLDGHSRAEHAREVLLQDGDDATQRDAESVGPSRHWPSPVQAGWRPAADQIDRRGWPQATAALTFNRHACSSGSV